MDGELTHFLRSNRYERSEGQSNHRNGSYSRKFTFKGIGEVGVKVPRGRKRRGPNGSTVNLGIMDGLSELEKVFMEEFPNAKVQRPDPRGTQCPGHGSQEGEEDCC